MKKKFKNTTQKFGIIILFLILYSLFFVSIARASTNILPDNPPNDYFQWAWNDVIGWIDFYSTENINVTRSQLTGFASSSVGYIALDCATAPVPPANCTSTYPAWKVENDGDGSLSGWAWNDAIGWISFDSATAGSFHSYQVTIDSDGYFNGWAWNDIIGWIRFNCGVPGFCFQSNYKVKTSWRVTYASGTLESAIFDTQIMGGAAPNSIMWHGEHPYRTSVQFQFASFDDFNNPAEFIGPAECFIMGLNEYSGGLGFINKFLIAEALAYDSDVFTILPDTPLKLDLNCFSNHRYFRYKIFLYSNSRGTLSPKVDDVIINWSP